MKRETILRDFYDFSMKNDPWGTSMMALFDVAGEMWNRSLPIPSKWEYSPGMSTPEIEDEYTRKEIQALTDDELSRFGDFLNRLTDRLKRNGHGY